LEVRRVATERSLLQAGVVNAAAIAGVLDDLTAIACDGLLDAVTECWRRRLARLKARERNEAYFQ
jgi:hypothetical protein